MTYPAPSHQSPQSHLFRQSPPMSHTFARPSLDSLPELSMLPADWPDRSVMRTGFSLSAVLPVPLVSARNPLRDRRRERGARPWTGMRATGIGRAFRDDPADRPPSPQASPKRSTSPGS